MPTMSFGDMTRDMEVKQRVKAVVVGIEVKARDMKCAVITILCFALEVIGCFEAKVVKIPSAGS